MAFRKSSDRPQISEIFPAAAIPGGEFQIRGKGLAGTDRPHVKFGEVNASVVIGSDSFVIARVPEGAPAGELMVGDAPYKCDIGILVADSLHPVSNPVVDHHGNIYTTFSGSPGQKAPVSIYKIDTHHRVKPLVSDLMNATGLTMDADGMLYASSRHEGIVYQVSPSGNLAVYVEGMGVATGIAFDQHDHLYVGDRSGTIFKISRERQIYVFATMEPSIAAYHLAFGPDECLYVTGPTTSSFDTVHRITPDGHVEVFYRGLGRPQGLAFDTKGNLYVSASLEGRRGVVRVAPDATAELFLSGPAIVGVAFAPSKSLILATNNSIYRVDCGIEGLRLP
ncbi:MAG TPA: IPT/TIG domain-containing protein [Bryobacteraceae bacterium]|nr:IPT/TIG domain-containing protein [Bryobacteraceae bacterium]